MSNIKKKLTLADKIKHARKSVGLSQKQLAEVLKLSDKAVSSYEVGRAIPPLPTLREISKVTYKPISYFMNEAENDDETLADKIALIERELDEIKKMIKKKKV